MVVRALSDIPEDVIKAAKCYKRSLDGDDILQIYPNARNKPKMRLGRWTEFEMREMAKAWLQDDIETLADDWLERHSNEL